MSYARRAVSRHSKIDTTAIYNKTNDENARQIAAKRREHIAKPPLGTTNNAQNEPRMS